MPTRSSSRYVRSPPAVDLTPKTSPARLGPMWLCIALGLLAVGALYWLVGLTWWSLLIAVLVLACPLVIVWILLGGFER
jgi:hypothetical protein